MNKNAVAKKNKYQIVILLAVLLLIFGGLTYAITRPAKVIADCREMPVTDVEPIIVTITDNGFDTGVVEATQCTSSLYLINQSSEDVSLAFGDHEDHIRYAGFNETVLAPDEETEIILYQHGDFKLHNHFNEEDFIDLRVAKNETLTQFASFQDAIPYDTESYNGSHSDDDEYHNQNN